MRRSLTDEDGEVGELVASDITGLRPIAEIDPGMLDAVAQDRRRGRPPVEKPRRRIGLRLAEDVVEGI